jgi:hypothetical protein
MRCIALSKILITIQNSCVKICRLFESWYLKEGVTSFLLSYNKYFSASEHEKIINQNAPNDVIKALFSTHKD